jgi:Flp pilus assembly protein TadB
LSQLAASNFHPKELKLAPNRLAQPRLTQTRKRNIMLIVFGLLILWVLSMYFYLPLPIVVLLFAAVATGVTLAVWVALNNRKQAHAVIERDSKY